MKVLLFLISFTISAHFLSAQNAVEPKDSSICITSSQLYRMGEYLVVSMRVDITRTIPSNESVVLIPQLNDSLGNFMQLPAIYINGRKQHIVFQREKARLEKGCEALKRQNDRLQIVRYLRSIPFSNWMQNSSLSLVEKECGCGVPLHTNTGFLTHLRILPDINPQLAFITPQVEEVKLREESGRAYLDFPLNETIIYPKYRDNPAELAKIKHSIDLIKNDTNVVISHIDIHGYASPEGPYKNNERLARERTRTLKDYVCSQYAFSDTLFSTRHTPEDWDGFRKLLNDTIMPVREEILRIVDSNDKPDTKEQKIRKRYPEQFNFMLKHWLPALRHSDYTIRYVVQPFTVGQAIEVFNANPKNLSIEEMFRIAQTYPVGSAEYNKVFMTAVLLNPEHPVANLNAACISLMQGDVVSAGGYLEKAPDSPEKTLAQGVLHLLKGEYVEAETLLREAEKEGLTQATENLKLLSEFY
ncbi:DUF3868 domain-containing protein [Phocaeicola sp.]